MKPVPQGQDDAPSRPAKPGSAAARPLDERAGRPPRIWVVAVVIAVGAAACLLVAGRGWLGISLVVAIQLSALAYIIRASSWPPAAPESAAVTAEQTTAASQGDDTAAPDDHHRPAG